MKITDYGLWYRNIFANAWTLINSTGEDFVYLNGTYIGYMYENRATVKVFDLTDIGFKVSRNSPGEKYDIYWDFPDNYILTESDFEEIE